MLSIGLTSCHVTSYTFLADSPHAVFANVTFVHVLVSWLIWNVFPPFAKNLILLEHSSKVVTSPYILTGSISIVRLMFSLQPEQARNCLSMRDDNGMVPLHRAAMFDSSDLVIYLIEQVRLGYGASRRGRRTRNPFLRLCMSHF